MGFLDELLEQVRTTAPEILEGKASWPVKFRRPEADDIYQLDEESLTKLDSNNQVLEQLTWKTLPDGKEHLEYHQPGKPPMNMQALHTTLTILRQVLRTNLARAEQAPEHAAALLQSIRNIYEPVAMVHKPVKLNAFSSETGAITFQIQKAKEGNWQKAAWHPRLQMTVNTDKLEIRTIKGEVLTLRNQDHPAPLTYQEPHSDPHLAYQFLISPDAPAYEDFKQLFVDLLVPCLEQIPSRDKCTLAGARNWVGLPASTYNRTALCDNPVAEGFSQAIQVIRDHAKRKPR